MQLMTANEKDVATVDWDVDIAAIIEPFLQDRDNWRIEKTLAGIHQNREYHWCSVRNSQCSLRSSGWKLHISAQIHNALDILETVLPILLQHRCQFKVAEDLYFLAYLNDCSIGHQQIGKFLTLYPEDDQEAVKIAKAIHHVTQSFNAPRVITDTPFAPQSIVYYRYGAFKPDYSQSLWGALLPIITVAGEQKIDQKKTNFAQAHPLHNPFTNDTPVDEANASLQKGRYVIAMELQHSVNSRTVLGVDIQKKRRCIIKTGYQNSTTELLGRSAANRLTIEKRVLQRLENQAIAPQYYDDFYDAAGHYSLVMEDIAGTSLQDFLLDALVKAQPIPLDKLVFLANELLRILDVCHRSGILHADLKLDNILLHHQQLVLIDFDSSCIPDAQQWIHACGSPGYQTLNRSTGGQPTIQDDLYAYGACLYYLFAAINPTSLPLEPGQHEVALRQLNQHIPQHYQRIIEGCLAGEFQSTGDIFAVLNDEKNHSSQNINHDLNRGETPYAEKLSYLAQRYLQNAFRPKNAYYAFNQTVAGDIELSDLRGIAGTTLSLAVCILNHPDTDTLREPLQHCVTQQRQQPKKRYNAIPGLYVGESGVALSLLYAGLALDDDALIDVACSHLSDANHQPYCGIDLFNGAAGRLRVNLIFYHITQNVCFLRAADALADHILTTAVQTEKQTYWINPEVNATETALSWDKDGKVLGYAHGVAGIADALLDYYQLTEKACVRQVIEQCVQTLIDQRIARENAETVLWPDRMDGEGAAPYWCFGGAGISKFLARAKACGFAVEETLIRQAITAILRYTCGSAPILCHGIAGNLECLLDLQQINEQWVPHQDIQRLETILSIWIKHYLNNQFKTQCSHFTYFGYLTGVAGLLSVYSRLTDTRKPNPLSLEYAHELREKHA